MQKIVQVYLLVMSEYMSFGIGAFATAIMATLIHVPHDIYFAVVGGVCVAASRVFVRQHRFGVTPEVQVKRYWLSLNETCITEFSIGSATLVFATAISGGGIVNIVVLIAVLGVSLCNIWKSRGTFDISVLQ